MFKFHVVFAALLGFAMPSAHAKLPEPKVATFDVNGLKLSMPYDVFRQLYPEAKVTEETAARYCYGKEVKIDPLTRRGAVIRLGDSIVRVTFGYKSFGQEISTIKRDEAIDFNPSRYTSLRDRLVRRYGPFTGIKYPHKMDPAGLIVGFEWKQKGAAYLSVTVHRDPTSDSNAIRQTTFLTRSLPDMEDQIKEAAYYRDAVRNFRAECARR